MIGLSRKGLRYSTSFVVVFGLLYVLFVLGPDITFTGNLDFSGSPATNDNEYLIDISIGECPRFCARAECCRTPNASSGKGGNLGAGGSGGWHLLKKDLGLGTRWTRKQYISYKTIKQQALDSMLANSKESAVIIDLAVERPSDSKIKGNEWSQIPSYILEIYNSKSEVAAASEEDQLATKGRSETSIDQKTKRAKTLALNIPKKEKLAEAGWVRKSHGLWVKYGAATAEAVSSVDVLFGGDAVEPRPNWKLLDALVGTLAPSNKKARLSIRRGPKEDYRIKYPAKLKFNPDGKFKILQVSDLHFGTGVGKCRDPVPKDIKECEADPRTLEYLEKVLDLEKPDFVVLTGDQDFGERTPDPQTAIFKVLAPFISRKIPFAVTLGNHDDETSLSRNDTLGISINLPYSLAERGPEDIDGFGNYVLNIEAHDSSDSAFTMYFLDSHSYTKNPKVLGIWDWIKENQLRWVERQYDALLPSMIEYKHKYMSMAFFHIPIPEFGRINQPFVGKYLEAPAGPRYNSGTREVLGKVKVTVASVGHDHINDYCLHDTQDDGSMWLCYGGGAGEAGYGGKGFIRRVRAWEIDTVEGQIKSWKRAQNSPELAFDEQVLVSGGDVMN